MTFLFSLFDQDGDGDISMEEFTKKMKEVCTTLTDSELQAVCRDCDQVCMIADAPAAAPSELPAH